MATEVEIRESLPNGLRLAAGRITGVSAVAKFGHNDAIGTAWEPITYGGVYQMPTAAKALEIVSDSADDAAAGLGAQEVTVMGLGADWFEAIQTVEMNGTTPVPLSVPLTRAYRAMVTRSGTYGTFSAPSQVGAITIREAGAGPTWAILPILDTYGTSQTQIGAYTLPKGKIGFTKEVVSYAETNQSVDVALFARGNADDVTPPYSGAMQSKVVFRNVNEGLALDTFAPVGPFYGPADIMFMGKANTSATVSVLFEILILDAGQFPDV